MLVFNSSVGDLVGTLALVQDRQDLLASRLEGLVNHLPGNVAQNLLSGEGVTRLRAEGIGTLSTAISDASGFLFNCLLIIPLMFSVVLRNKRQIGSEVVARIPDPYRTPFEKAAARVIDDLRSYVYAKGLESLIVGSVCCFGFFLFGVKGWLVLGILAGILNVIPYLGPLIGAIPPLAVTLVSDQSWVLLGVVGTVLVAQLVDNFYVLPFLVSSEVAIDPLLSIVLTLVGADAFGVVGMTFAIPFFLVYRIVLVAFYRQFAWASGPPAPISETG